MSTRTEARLEIAARLHRAAVEVSKAVLTSVKAGIADQGLFALSEQTTRLQQGYTMPDPGELAIGPDRRAAGIEGITESVSDGDARKGR